LLHSNASYSFDGYAESRLPVPPSGCRRTLQQSARSARMRDTRQRMVRDPRAARIIGHVLQQWAAPELDIVAKADAVYPEFDRQLRAAMLEQFEQFAAMSLRDGLDLRALFRTARAPVNASLAQLLGVSESDSGSDWNVIELPAPRFGLLTLPGLLTAKARADDIARPCSVGPLVFRVMLRMIAMQVLPTSVAVALQRRMGRSDIDAFVPAATHEVYRSQQ
jgi:hypothetical protein